MEMTATQLLLLLPLGVLGVFQEHRHHYQTTDRGRRTYIHDLLGHVHAPEWTWSNGHNVGNQHSFVGNLLLSSKTRYSGYPGARTGSLYWSDHGGHMWMFGGEGYNEKPTNEPKLLSDLWRYNSDMQEWELVHSDSIVNHTHFHAIRPAPRKLGVACGTAKLAIVIFGGEGHRKRVMNDTWVYDIPATTWIPLYIFPGPEARTEPAVWCIDDKLIIYGGLGHGFKVLSDMWEFSMRSLRWKQIFSPQNLGKEKIMQKAPKGRNGAVTWVDFKSKDLYMFGGNVLDSLRPKDHYGVGLASSLWKFSLFNLTWQLLSGDDSPRHPGYYGKQGVYDSRNQPGCRKQSAAWTDKFGNLWLFGGEGTDTSIIDIFHPTKLLSDLWIFNIFTSQWSWVGGLNTGEGHAVYGKKGELNSTYLPGPRCQMVSWEHNGTMYLFGGIGHDGRTITAYLDDLWNFRPKYFVQIPPEGLFDWLKTLSPGYIFLICMSGIGGIAMVCFGALCLKKVFEYPRYSPKDFNVRYSPLTEQTEFET